MAYTDVWNGAIPNGTEPANTIDDIFRSLKLDISERLDDIFAMPTFVTDPLRPYGLKFTDAQDAIIRFGDNAGTPRSIIIKDKTATNSYVTINPGSIIINRQSVGASLLGYIGFTRNSISLGYIGQDASDQLVILDPSAGVANLTISTGGNVSSRSNLIAGLDVIVQGGNFLNFLGKSLVRSPVDGNIIFLNNAGTSFGLLQFGGTTASFPAWKRSGVTLQARLADDSGDAALSANTGLFSGDITLNSATVAAIDFYNTNFRIQTTQATGVMDFKTNNVVGLSLANGGVGVTIPGTLAVTGQVTLTSQIQVGAASLIGWTGRTEMQSTVNGNLFLSNNAGTDFGLLQFGGTTASFPALKRSTTLLQVRTADDSGFLLLQAAGIVAPDFSSTSSGVDVTIHNGGTLVATFSGTSGLTTLTGGLTTSSTITSGSSLVAAAGSSIVWAGRSVLSSAVNGNILLSNNAISAFGLLQLGGTTSAFAAIKANANQLQIRLADDSGFANIIANAYEVQASGQFFFTGRSGIQSTADGNIVLLNNATTDFGRLQFGGTTSSFPSLKKSGSSLAVRKADDSGYAQLNTGVVAYDNGTVPQLWQVGALTHITGIAAVATTIVSAATAGIVIVQGTDGGGNSFKDVVVFGSAITTQADGTVTGAPAVRTYSVVAGSLKLAMASGTYTVDPLFIG